MHRQCENSVSYYTIGVGVPSPHATHDDEGHGNFGILEVTLQYHAP